MHISTMVTGFYAQWDFVENEGAQEAYRAVVEFLDLEEHVFDLFLDILSANPYKIFKCNVPFPKINLKTFEIQGGMEPTRLALIADILDVRKNNVKRFAALWIYNYNLSSMGMDALR